MLIDAGFNIYDIAFSFFQVEITGRCNMHCKHCRGKNDKRADMELSDFLKIINFAKRNSDKNQRMVLSGGEPFLHKNLMDILQLSLVNGIKNITITTNGSINLTPYLKVLKCFDSLSLSVSIDSFHCETHDSFRGCKGALQKAMEFIETSTRQHIRTSIRVSILPSTIGEMEDMVQKAIEKKVNTIAFGSILPAGEALNDKTLFMTGQEKKRFLFSVFHLRMKYKGKIMIKCSDPLLSNFQNEKKMQLCPHIRIINGCTAGIGTFNVFANGNLTPCSAIEYAITNIFNQSVEAIEHDYMNHDLIKKLAERAIKGKCSKCVRLFECSGCRARAYYKYHDYLGEDPDCWL